jgi:hypothetical protein
VGALRRGAVHVTRKPLEETRLAVITTAAAFQPGVGDQGPGARYNAAAKFYRHRMRRQ